MRFTSPGFGHVFAAALAAVVGSASLGACGSGQLGADAAGPGASTASSGAGGAATASPGGGAGGAIAPTGNDAGPPVADAAAPAHDLHFVVYGDSRSNPTPHQSVVDAFAKVSPELVVATGDLWDGYGPEKWRSIVTKNANVGELLAKNLFLVSRGNHETVAEVQAFSPTLLRDGAERYSFSFGNSFFVSLGMDPSKAASTLEAALASDAAKAATWRFVYSHYPIYSAGPHGGDGLASIEALCDKYGVAVYFCGHDHLYERSHQLADQKVVDQGDALSVAKGVVYVVTGGGGAPLYATGKIPSTHVTKSTLHFLDVVATATQVSVKAETPDGKVFDAFTIAK